MQPASYRLTVLVVDDDSLPRMLARAALESLGHRVVNCGAADDALHQAKAKGRDRFFSYEMRLDTEEQRPH